MKLTKWTKWQIGALGAAGVAVLFHQVKASPEFAAAAAAHHAAASPPKAQSELKSDPVTEQWQKRQDNGSVQGQNQTVPQERSFSTARPQTRTRHS